jgi:hypothetical protein
MGQLDRGHGAMILDEPSDGSPSFNLSVVPDSGVGSRDSPIRIHRRGFGHDETRATNRATTQVDQMPVVRDTLLSGVHTHRGDTNSVSEFDVADFDGIE